MSDTTEWFQPPAPGPVPAAPGLRWMKTYAMP
jgi:hypothetical protein